MLRIALLLAGLAALAPFSIDTYLPAFPAIAADLGASRLQVQQTFTAYLAPYAFMMLWHGTLSDAWGRRWRPSSAAGFSACSDGRRCSASWPVRHPHGPGQLPLAAGNPAAAGAPQPAPRRPVGSLLWDSTLGLASGMALFLVLGLACHRAYLGLSPRPSR
jgi:MFS family permease